MDELFCVLHKDPAYSPERTADFLALERCVGREEAAAAFKKSQGFLLENASLGKASAFNLRASAFGFETLLLSRRDLRPPPPAAAVLKIEFKTEGFYYVSNSVREHLPYDSVKAVAACAFSVETPPKDAAGTEAGLISSLRARYFPFALPFGEKYESPPVTPLPPAPAKETVFLADLLAGPAPLRLTLACDTHDYSGLGPKKTLSSFENFRILMEELSARAPGAVRNHFLRALLEKKNLSGLKYPSAEAYEKELEWLATILN
ncbi:MAG: hypothetical protein WCW52_08380 [Elusimicrobiales bacterium]|jgi:hypothetical protein